MAPNNRVSRGNTSDLVGLWNKIATTETTDSPSPRSRSRSPISGNLTATNQFKFRKTSAYEPSPSSLSPDVHRVENPHIRKTSALVLMPTHNRSSNLSIDTTDSVTGGEAGYKPRKISAMSTLSVQVGFPLKSALKNSTGNLTANQENSAPIPTVVTSPPPEAAARQTGFEARRGSNLGRSKSVKCNRVKFGSVTDNEEQGAPNSPHFLLRHGAKPEEKKLSPFDKFRNMDNQNNAATSASSIAPGRLTRQASLPSVCANGPRSAPPPVDQQQQSGNSPTQKRSVMSRSPSSAKELLLMWAQQRTNSYPNMNVTNFSTSWNDGLAFCALIHYYYPEAFDFDKLDPKNRKENFELAFKAAEDYAGICPLLDVEDMVMMTKPDWKCVFTYVQSFYRRFRNGRDPPPPTRILALTPEDNKQVSNKTSLSTETSTASSNVDKPLTLEKQKSLLSKYMIDDEEEKRSKIRSTKTSPRPSSSVSFAPKTTFLEKKEIKSELQNEAKNRPPLTSSLSLSSYPNKFSTKQPSPSRLTSVEEKVRQESEVINSSTTTNTTKDAKTSEVADQTSSTATDKIDKKLSEKNPVSDKKVNENISSSVSVTSNLPSPSEDSSK